MNNKITLATLDLETITIPNSNGLQIPIAKSTSYFVGSEILTRLFTINYKSLDLCYR